MFACNGILFNHESPRRGETFVTRKITRGIANIYEGIEKCLYLGNLDARRDWGHAKDYVKMQWMMLQQEAPEDFVIATGEQFSVKEFIKWSAEAIGIGIEFKGSELDEYGYISSLETSNNNLKVGDVIVRVDKKYFRPTEVESLLGDPTKAKEKLGWTPKISTKQMCKEMVFEDLRKAKERILIESNKRK